MRSEPCRGASSIQGQLLRHSERREVAIFLRDGALWVADFIDGDGELVEATTWFRFNCGSLCSPHARRRMVLESAVPLSADLVEKIGRLHVSPAPHQRGLKLRLRAAVRVRGLFTRLEVYFRRFYARERPP